MLIVLASKGKLKKKKKEDKEELNQSDVEAGSVYGPIGGADSRKAGKAVEMRKLLFCF